MKWNELLDKWSLTGLKVNAGFLKMEFQPNDVDKNAAWEMYIELLTRITTQALADKDGDEQTALTSIYNLFDITRDIIKNNGRHCTEFSKIAIIILNQKIRPFTAKWHKLSLDGAFEDKELCSQFRDELKVLQQVLNRYSGILADMVGVEDLTQLEITV